MSMEYPEAGVAKFYYFCGKKVHLEIKRRLTNCKSLVHFPFLRFGLVEGAGIAVYYADTFTGVPPVLSQLISHWPVLFEVNIFLTNRFVPVPEVMPKERLLVEQLGVKGFYHVIARYGYMERVQQGQGFMIVLLDHVIALLYKAMAHKVDANENLRKIFNLPSDSLARPHPEDSQLTLSHVPLKSIFPDPARAERSADGASTTDEAQTAEPEVFEEAGGSPHAQHTRPWKRGHR
eukprot:jgi/Botrbrau1/9220/Bobra.0028s0016.1